MKKHVFYLLNWKFVIEILWKNTDLIFTKKKRKEKNAIYFLVQKSENKIFVKLQKKKQKQNWLK